uniref:Uncharacterized protein n=1 Tax=Moniliophthora roreri TaxID=221103 RepID=A0A0W0FL80_MONRR
MSNIHFQSHTEACAVLITYLKLFIKFLGKDPLLFILHYF